MTRQQESEIQMRVADILKSRFGNLTVRQTLELSIKITEAIHEVLSAGTKP